MILALNDIEAMVLLKILQGISSTIINEGKVDADVMDFLGLHPSRVYEMEKIKTELELKLKLKNNG